MLVAIISDIHANLEALTAVLEDIETQSVDSVVCLGDVVGYGADPVPCVETIMRVSSICLAGNHDYAALGLTDLENFNTYAREAALWTRSQLTPKTRKFLESCPLVAHELSGFFVHSSPIDPPSWNYILSVYDALQAFDHFEESTCFVGHSHVPLAIERNQERGVKAIGPQEIVFQENSRYIVNVGSVGQPRDGDPRASYGLWDTEKTHFRLQRVAYDVQNTQYKILETGLPEFLAVRLMYGE